MSFPISPPTVTNYEADYLPAYLSNGLIGVRVPRIPFIGGLAIVNGFAGMHPEDRVESFARAPYPLGGDVQLGGVWLSQAPQQVTFVDQRYDFSCGELITRLRYMVDGQMLQLEILTFCSRSLPTVIAQEIRARCDRDCEISLRSVIDPTGIPGKQLVRETTTPGEATLLSTDHCAGRALVTWQPAVLPTNQSFWVRATRNGSSTMTILSRLCRLPIRSRQEQAKLLSCSS
jgi:hypothetical protein